MSAATPPEVTFAGGTLDREGPRRTDVAWLEAARADPQARVVVVGRTGVGDIDGPADPDAIFLGTGDGRPVFAQPAGEDADQIAVLQELRGAAASLGAAEAGLFAYASAMVFWHRATAYCGRCGAPTTSGEAGHVRTCENGHGHHPRTDPVVIMLVVDRAEDRILLGRQPSWPERRYSTLAGFVEPGESLEHAVRREIGEEAGVQVGGVRYVASQPWPFPANLMLGFEAEYVSGEARVVDQELEAVRWFTREEVTAAAAGDEPWPSDGSPPPAPSDAGELLLPPRLAIARTLVEGWLAAPPA